MRRPNSNLLGLERSSSPTTMQRALASLSPPLSGQRVRLAPEFPARLFGGGTVSMLADRRHPSALLDVVMESPDARLACCQDSRDTRRQDLKIVIRTGQPGCAGTGKCAVPIPSTVTPERQN